MTGHATGLPTGLPTGIASCLALAALLLASLAPAAAETGAYVDLRPTRALRLAATQGPDIPGVTYPRNAPPDLLAEHAPEMNADPEPEAAADVSPQPADVPPQPAVAAQIPASPPAAEAPHQPEAAPAPPPAVANAEPAPPPATPVTLRLDVDLATQRLTITERGDVKAVWPISSGRASTPTQTGTFRPQWASRMWYSRQYDMAPMPHAVFFNGGIAFHATQATHLLGRPASHGCVRLAPPNARALYGMIHAHGYAHTEIVVTGRGAPKVASSDKRKPRPRATASDTTFWSFF